MIDNTERRLRRLLSTIDARLIETMTAREDLLDEDMRDIAMLEAARGAVLRVMSERSQAGERRESSFAPSRAPPLA